MVEIPLNEHYVTLKQWLNYFLWPSVTITFISERPAALNTAETLRVPVLVQSGDHFLNNRRKNKMHWFKLRVSNSTQPETCARSGASHSVWACCSAHSEGRRGWSSPTRSTVARPSRRSCGCPTPSHTRCRQSAPGATPFPELSPPAWGNK